MRFLTGLLVFLALSAQADVIQKHPRVAELEDKLTHDAEEYLKGRFPDHPFLVTVTIDPLRRVEEPKQAKAGEDLPYFDADSEEIQDEWDDPQMSLSRLMLRIKKASVKITLPASVNDDETSEIKDSIFSYLHLTPARDEVTIERKGWHSDAGEWTVVAIGFSAALLFLIGLFIINRSSTQKITRALSEGAKSAGASAGGGVAQAPASAPAGAAPEERVSGAADLKFSDPIRVREVTARMMDSLQALPGFPNHYDMIALDDFGRKHSRELGAILHEFPAQMQKKLFSMSFHSCWLEAFNKPGSLGLECMELLQKMLHHPRNEKQNEWESCLIYVWRLEDERVRFIQKLKKDHAFAILSELPKNIAIDTGRKAFPGAWAMLLNPESSGAMPSEEEIREISDSALKLKPLFDLSLLQRYRNESELLDYLKYATPYEEREIYEASPEDSSIHRLRKPFYPMLEQDRETLEEMIQKASVNEWAMVLFNVERSGRKVFEELFSEKQRYVFKEQLKNLDIHGMNFEKMAAARERLANILSEVLKQKAKVQPTSPNLEIVSAPDEAEAA